MKIWSRLFLCVMVCSVIGLYQHSIRASDGGDGITLMRVVSFPVYQDRSNGYSSEPQLSQDGEYIIFSSVASNLRVEERTLEQIESGEYPSFDKPTVTKIYRYGIKSQLYDLVSVSSADSPNLESASQPSASADGNVVTFISTDHRLVGASDFPQNNVLVRNIKNGTTKLVSHAPNGDPADKIAWHPAVSADGRWIAFESLATNLDPNDQNGTWDIYLYDVQTDDVILVSRTESGMAGNDQSREVTISADGRWIGYSSFATDLVFNDSNPDADIYLYDRWTGQNWLLQPNQSEGQFAPSISADGSQIVYLQGSPAQTVLYQRDTQQQTIVSRSAMGEIADLPTYSPYISAEGDLVLFISSATNLLPLSDDFQLYRYQTETGLLDNVSSVGETLADYQVFSPSSAQNGKMIAFQSSSDNLAKHNGTIWDVFLRREFDHAIYLPQLSKPYGQP